MAKSRVEQQLQELGRLRRQGTITDEEYQHRRQAILTDTSLADGPQASRRGGIFRWGLFGCLGILAAVGLAVIILVVVIAAALSNLGDDEDDLGGDVRVALTVGATGEIAPEGNGSRRSKVTILEIVDGGQSENPFLQPDEGRKFWAVRVEIENVGSSEVTSLDWKLRDSLNIESDRTFFADLGPNLEPAYTLTPGGKATGWVVFEIDAAASPTWLRADPNPFLAHDLYFDAP